MNLRTRVLLIAFAPCLLPLSAGELGLLYTKQFGKAQTIAGADKYDAVDTASVGIRGGFSVVDFKVVEFSFTGTYQPKAEQDLVLGGSKRGRYGVSYAALGAQLDWKLLLNLNAGVEMRRETLSWDLDTLGKDESTQTRPWVRAGLGFSLPLPVVSPFLRLEVAVPLSKEDRTSSPDSIRKALAPQLQAGVYAGIRF
ncbi:MAG: hypothetical protein KGN80_09700 [Acidobacteriota bacterium]|nr:hypothetical protein [Acidobacteriota bacterium]